MPAACAVSPDVSVCWPTFGSSANKVATEKCDGLAGDAKTSCMADAKARFGKT
ncbi:MAG: hypothetical protein IPG93_06255 [Burkholderiales bacterium]|nr:hypothetical protein [Burkholderiales bacterium]